MTSEIISASKTISQYSNILIKGVMIIPPITEDKKIYLGYFKKTREIQEAIKQKIPECKNISMGMSGAYVDAIKEGATHIRIGTALFGERRKLSKIKPILRPRATKTKIIIDKYSFKKISSIYYMYLYNTFFYTYRCEIYAY